MKSCKLLSLIALAWIPLLACGQGAPAQLTDPHGDNPFGSYQASDIDQIAFANGALDVRIPLFAHSGRGLGHLKFFRYTNKTWFAYSGPVCDPSVMQCPPPPTPSWIYSDNTTMFSNLTVYPSPCGSGGFGSAKEYTNFTYVDDAGTRMCSTRSRLH